MSYYYWGKFQTHAFHVAPSISPIVSVMNLLGLAKLAPEKQTS